jgi:hypothetical protein
MIVSEDESYITTSDSSRVKQCDAAVHRKKREVIKAMLQFVRCHL